MRILQREKETLLTVIRLAPAVRKRFPPNRRKPAEDVPACVQNHGQFVCVAVASAVKVGGFETIATAPPQQFETLPAERREDRPKVIALVRENTIVGPPSKSQSINHSISFDVVMMKMRANGFDTLSCRRRLVIPHC
jgi:hypothetical protein